MTEIKLSNAVPDSSLSGGITDSATSLDVQSGDGADFPTVPFKIGINSEAMLVTAVSTDTFTVTRSYDGTTATAHSDTDVVKHIFTAEDFPFRLDDTTDDYMLQKDINLNGNVILPGVIVASMSRTADQTLAAFGTYYKAEFTVEDFDTDGTVVDLTNNRLIAPRDGYYRIGGNCDVTNGSTGAYQLIDLRLNGTLYKYIFRGANQLNTEQRPWSMLLWLDEDDYVEVWISLPTATYKVWRASATLNLEFVG